MFVSGGNVSYKTGLVSIIVPVYNVELYLWRCVESLLNQTYSNIEILLIDDCSKDNSLEICYKLAKIDSRIRVVINDVNLGLSNTRNKGINASSGEWLMCLDSDDTFTLDAVEKMYNFARSANVDVAFASYTSIQSKKTEIKKASLKDGVYSNDEIASELLENIQWNVLCCVGAKIYNKRFMDEFSIRFDDFYKYNEDGAFMLATLSKAKRIGYINEPFYQYFIRTTGSIQSSYRVNMFFNLKKTNAYLKKFLCDYGAFSSGQKNRWINKQVTLYWACIINEARFKNYSCFKDAIKEIEQSEEYEEVIKNSTLTGVSISVMKICMKLNLDFILYILIKSYFWKHVNN